MLYCSIVTRWNAFELGSERALRDGKLKQPLWIETRPLKASPPVEVRAGGPTARPNPTEDVPLGDLLPRLHPGRLQVIIHGEESPPVMDDHRVAAEEQLTDIGHHAAVARPDRRAGFRLEIDAGMGAAGLTVDDPPEPECATDLSLPVEGCNEGVPPVWFPSPRLPDRFQHGLLPANPFEGFRIQIDHRLGEREMLQGKSTVHHRDLYPAVIPLSRLPLGCHLDRMRAGRRLEIHREQDGVCASSRMRGEARAPEVRLEPDERLGRRDPEVPKVALDDRLSGELHLEIRCHPQGVRQGQETEKETRPQLPHHSLSGPRCDAPFHQPSLSCSDGQIHQAFHLSYGCGRIGTLKDSRARHEDGRPRLRDPGAVLDLDPSIHLELAADS